MELRALRRRIVSMYRAHPTGCGDSFGEILCFEIHAGDKEQFLDRDESVAKNGLYRGCDFKSLAIKWGIPLETLGELISDHCRRL